MNKQAKEPNHRFRRVYKHDNIYYIYMFLLYSVYDNILLHTHNVCRTWRCQH